MKRSPLKRSTEPMKRTPMRRIGKKSKTWIDIRKDIKKRFGWAGITVCEFRFEGCWFNEALGFAHCRKRRKLTDEEMYHVALACNPCHDKLELMSPEEMHDAVHEKITRRGLIAPPGILQQIQSHQDGD